MRCVNLATLHSLLSSAVPRVILRSMCNSLGTRQDSGILPMTLLKPSPSVCSVQYMLTHPNKHIEFNEANWVRTGCCHSVEVHLVQPGCRVILSEVTAVLKKKKKKWGGAIEADTKATGLVALNDYRTVCCPQGVTAMSRKQLFYLFIFFKYTEELSVMSKNSISITLHVKMMNVVMSRSCQTCNEKQLLVSNKLLQSIYDQS